METTELIRVPAGVRFNLVTELGLVPGNSYVIENMGSATGYLAKRDAIPEDISSIIAGHFLDSISRPLSIRQFHYSDGEAWFLFSKDDDLFIVATGLEEWV